jgi:ABC-type dipeptide/oligopeptide/nickel transport system permease subunit
VTATLPRLTASQIAGILTLALLLLCAAGAEWIAPYDPHIAIAEPFDPPSADHWLGTNDIGQDILSELIHGTRASLGIGVLAAAIAVGIGTVLGLLAGYFGGAIDSTVMRGTDLALTVPFLPMMILLAAYLGPGAANLVLVIGLLTWARPGRLIRAQVLGVAERDHVLAARACGASHARILGWHVLPHLWPLINTQFVLGVSAAITLEAGLSFLGLGDPTLKSWGSMLFYAQARNAFLAGSWPWWVVPPGLMITAAVLGFALLGSDPAISARLTPRR